MAALRTAAAAAGAADALAREDASSYAVVGCGANGGEAARMLVAARRDAVAAELGVGPRRAPPRRSPLASYARRIETFAIGGDLRVRRLGLGAMRLCGPGILGWPEPREHALGLLRRAVELGVQLVDTALAYGPEVKEKIAFVPYFPLHVAGARAALEEIGRRHGATVAQVALAWLLHRSPVVCPIPGTSSREHLEENVAAGRLRLSPEDLALLG